MRFLPAILLLSACGAQPDRPRLPEGTAVYTVRLNPPACLVDRPELHYEVRTDFGWERVAIEGEEEDDGQVEALRLAFTDPTAHHQIQAKFTRFLVPWPGGHQARLLRLLDLQPESPKESP